MAKRGRPRKKEDPLAGQLLRSDRYSSEAIRQRMWAICDTIDAMVQTGELPVSFVKTQTDLYKQLVTIERDSLAVEERRYNLAQCKVFMHIVITALKDNITDKKISRGIIDQIERELAINEDELSVLISGETSSEVR